MRSDLQAPPLSEGERARVPLRPVPVRRPRTIETKDLASGPGGFLALSADETGVFEGYASLFDVVDLGRDMVMPGAFAESLQRRGVSGIRMLWQHDPGQPLGAWQVLREDARGLFVRGRLNPGVARAREVLALLRQRALDGLSIGYRTVTAQTEPRTGVRRLLRIDLWEISLVTFPLLPQARVTAVKASLASTDARALAGLERRGRRRSVQPSPGAADLFRQPLQPRKDMR
ncbi:MAG: HK97 family phage prohead protease [Alsobacter sp.]